MADILIRGMEMPKYTMKAEFGIDANGNPLCIIYHEDGAEPDIYDVVPLPEGHGKLIDADALKEEFKKSHNGKRLMLIDTAPTIVPAEGSVNDGA